ncbi:MAG: NUDIX hydrolase [Paraburkholderia sp.]|uniref:NUDIX hydrolase n=1 Tax=Paraburkholderia sp. TaxID=1926495 RepID=UPI00120FC3F7|nr:NUDIX hydrolase [Paraburkholderia sp.]TAM00210.1 MAG: NUDIX hydrolase [Paraburkholderia sp.]TAM31718.1 MAG: NUDIX hydrolase [Paraburkholderia sp.]
MNEDIWAPHVTVAAIIERDGRYLVVEEHTPAGLRLNQPAGHLEAGETLVDAVVRETLEETAYAFTPSALVGVYMTHFGQPGESGATYLRFTYCGTVADAPQHRALDPDIVRTLWMSADELRAASERHRTPLVMKCIDDYLAGVRIPLDFVHVHAVGQKARPKAGQNADSSAGPQG